MPSDATTFSLEAPLPPPSWGRPLHSLRQLGDPRAQRFTCFSVGGVLVTGGATALFYEGGGISWGLVLVAGFALLARALWLWRRRPFLRLDGSGLTFRLTPDATTRSLRWNDLTYLGAELRHARLHRENAPPLDLTFDALPGDTAHRLTRHLADTARQHGVPVHSA